MQFGLNNSGIYFLQVKFGIHFYYIKAVPCQAILELFYVRFLFVCLLGFPADPVLVTEVMIKELETTVGQLQDVLSQVHSQHRELRNKKTRSGNTYI